VKIEDVRRKIALLSRIRTDNGAMAAEAENAARMVKELMQRYTIKAEQVEPKQGPVFRLTWVYWQELFKEFGLQFSHLGHRGSATLGYDKMIYIKLGNGEWRIEKRSGGGLHTTARDRGVESLRKYLSQNARSYSFLRH
jgi:hypothetical protein